MAIKCPLALRHAWVIVFNLSTSLEGAVVYLLLQTRNLRVTERPAKTPPLRVAKPGQNTTLHQNAVIFRQKKNLIKKKSITPPTKRQVKCFSCAF